MPQVMLPMLLNFWTMLGPVARALQPRGWLSLLADVTNLRRPLMRLPIGFLLVFAFAANAQERYSREKEVALRCCFSAATSADASAA